MVASGKGTIQDNAAPGGKIGQIASSTPMPRNNRNETGFRSHTRLDRYSA